MRARNLDDIYGTPLVEWKDVTAELDRGIPQAPDSGGPNRHSCWLTTINPDGSPHVTGVGAMWSDGTFWFETGGRTRKARNIEADARCAIAVATHDFDLVVEGLVERVMDASTVARLAARWNAGGWPCEPDASGIALTAPFSAPSAGPPPWFVYRITARRATALATVEPGGATRFDF
jgi:hypothetical protein